MSALLEGARGRIKLVDPILGGELWMTRAVNEESTGYFLVPADKPLPPGWRAVDDEEAVAVRGKCLYPVPDPGSVRRGTVPQVALPVRAWPATA